MSNFGVLNPIPRPRKLYLIPLTKFIWTISCLFLFETCVRGTVNGVVLNKFFQPGPLPAAQSLELHAESSNEIRYFGIGDGRKFGAAQIKSAFGKEYVQHTGLIQAFKAMDIPEWEPFHADINQLSHRGRVRLQHNDGVFICPKSRIMSSFWLKIPDQHQAMAGTGQLPKVTRSYLKNIFWPKL